MIDREIHVLEREPYWAPELRRQFADEPITVRHLTTASDLDRAGTARERIIVLHPGDDSRLLAECLRHLPGSVSVFVGIDKHRELECPLREGGATSFVSGQLSGEELARRIRKAWRIAH